MAALPLCASWSPPSGVAVASRIARPASRVTRIHSLGRRGPSPLPIRIQARTRASHLRCPKAGDRDRDHGLEPQPEPERGDCEPDAAAAAAAAGTEVPLIPSNSYDNTKILEQREFRKAFCAAWLPGEASDMFRIEKDEISNYINHMMVPCRANLQDLHSKVVALFVCAEAQEALDLASIVMDLTHIESLDHGTIQLFDQHTTNQVIRMCTPVFCHVAKAAYLKRIEKDTVLSFLDALRGLGLFCHMLFQQNVFKLKDGPLKNSISIMLGTHSRNFDKKMKSLKEEFVRSMDADTGMQRTSTKYYEVIFTPSRGMKHAQPYILQMIPHWSLFA